MIVFNSRCVDGGGCLCPRPHGTSQATQLQAGGLTRAIEEITSVCKERHLKVSSGQIRSAWEWYHWIGHDKDISHNGFLIFLILVLNVRKKDFKVLSRFIQKSLQPSASSAHGWYRILSSYWLAQFYLMKKSAKVLLYFGLDCGMLGSILLPCRSLKKNCWPSRIFRDWFEEKDFGLCPYNPPAEEV